MYQLTPPAVYIFDEVFQDKRSLRRTEAMLGAIGRNLASAKRVTDGDIPDMIRRNGWQNSRQYQGTLGEHTDPAFVFRKLRFDDAPDVADVLKDCPPETSSWLVGNLLGDGGRGIHKEPPDSGRICRSRYQFDSIYGCPHGCKYCGAGKVIVIFTNIEEFLEKQVAPTARENPWQKVFMFNSNLTDTLCFEPEYGLTSLLAEYYASTADQHFLIHTKSANVDPLMGLDHRGHTIALWSLTGETVSRVIEPASASTEERIDAARRCQEAGYPVRFKFKPIIPVRNWRDECRDMIEMVFAQTKPETLGLCTIAWMTAAEFKQIIDVSLIDPVCLKAMEDSAEVMAEMSTGPFPPEVRAEIYGFFLDEIRKHDKDVPVYLCTESPEIWHQFADRLGLTGANYACGCGPQCPPGTRRLASVLGPVGDS